MQNFAISDNYIAGAKDGAVQIHRRNFWPLILAKKYFAKAFMDIGTWD